MIHTRRQVLVYNVYNNDTLTDEENTRWQGYYQWVRTYETPEGWTEEKLLYTWKATNPPEAWEHKDHTICVSTYCEDGVYPTPVACLPPGVIRQEQHRTLYGVEYVE